MKAGLKIPPVSSSISGKTGAGLPLRTACVLTLIFFLFLAGSAVCLDRILPTLPSLIPGNEVSSPPGGNFKNVEKLTHLDRIELERAMAFMTESLNVKCMFCHVPENFADGTQSEFSLARKMLGMVQFVETGFLKKDEKRLTCFTCHGGQTHPPRFPEGIKSLPALIPEKDKRNLPESYTNVQKLTHLTELEYIEVMNFFLQSMGASDCSACHNTDDFALDNRQRKVRARQMITLVRKVNPEFFETERVTCFTCHHGTFPTEPLPENWSGSN